MSHLASVSMLRSAPAPAPKPPHLSRLSFPRSSFVQTLAQKDYEGTPRRKEDGLIGFDAGHNASTAWNGRLDVVVHEHDRNTDEVLRSRGLREHHSPKVARSLYVFNGVSQNELSFEANTSLTIHDPDIGSGWALASLPTGKYGLCPLDYFVYVSGFTLSPALHSGFLSDTSSQGSYFPRQSSGSSEEIGKTPSGAAREDDSILAQFTGLGWLRKNVLGEKSLNRLSAFVQSGTEDWILNGASSTRSRGLDLAIPASSSLSSGLSVEDKVEQHIIDAGPSWKAQTPIFTVMVHSPQQQEDGTGNKFTVYQITSEFPAARHSQQKSFTSTSSGTRSEIDDQELTPSLLSSLPDSSTLEVRRRYTHFTLLQTYLTTRFPLIVIPPLPDKHSSLPSASKLEPKFIEDRRYDLEKWLRWVIGHPVLRCSAVVMGFVGDEEEVWLHNLRESAKLEQGGMFVNTFHSDFNVDIEEASMAVDNFEKHLKSISRGIQDIRDIWPKQRQAMKEQSDATRQTSYALLSLLTGRLIDEPEDRIPFEGKVDKFVRSDPEEEGAVNKQNAWCWKERCHGCAESTKGLKDVAEVLQDVADLEDTFARQSLLDLENGLKEFAYPSTLYTPIVEIHKATSARYEETTQTKETNLDRQEGIASRCETVLNITMSEMEHYHHSKPKFRDWVSEYLSEQINHHRAILDRLEEGQKRLLESSTLSRSQQNGVDVKDEDEIKMVPISRYEAQLGRPHRAAELAIAGTHVWDGSGLLNTVIGSAGFMWTTLRGG